MSDTIRVVSRTKPRDWPYLPLRTDVALTNQNSPSEHPTSVSVFSPTFLFRIRLRIRTRSSPANGPHDADIRRAARFAGGRHHSEPHRQRVRRVQGSQSQMRWQAAVQLLRSPPEAACVPLQAAAARSAAPVYHFCRRCSGPADAFRSLVKALDFNPGHIAN